jgi:hypothetical protein
LLLADGVWLPDESRAEQVHSADVLTASRENVLLHQAGGPDGSAAVRMMLEIVRPAEQ